MSDTLHSPAYVTPTPAAIVRTHVPTGSRGVCGCGAPVTMCWHPCLGPEPKWLHDNAQVDCAVIHDVHLVSTP